MDLSLDARLRLSDSKISEVKKIFTQLPRKFRPDTKTRLEQGRLLEQAFFICETYQLSFRYRCTRGRIEVKKAMTLIYVYQAYCRKTLSVSTIEELGWTKVSLIAEKLGNGMGEYWIEKARSVNVLTLKSLVQEPRGQKMKTMSFNLTIEECEEIKAVLQLYGAKKNQRGLENRNQALVKAIRAAARTVRPRLRYAA